MFHPHTIRPRMLFPSVLHSVGFILEVWGPYSGLG
jgi:hypothetical protein